MKYVWSNKVCLVKHTVTGPVGVLHLKKFGSVGNMSNGEMNLLNCLLGHCCITYHDRPTRSPPHRMQTAAQQLLSISGRVAPE